jgi:dihydroorotase
MVVGPHYTNLGDLRLIDPDGIAATAAAHHQAIVGIKMLATANTVGALGFEPLRRGRALAEELRLPLVVHVGESWSDEPALPIARVVELLRPGDTLTHLYTSQRGGVLDGDGRLDPAVREARARGVRFDVGHGINNLSFAVARRVLDQGFPPDTVSTDCSLWNVHGPVYDLPTTMSKLVSLGIPLADVVAMATSRSAALLGRADELGSLAVGRVADVSLMRLEEGAWTAVDATGEQMTARRRLVPVLTVRAGETIEPRLPDRPATA